MKFVSASGMREGETCAIASNPALERSMMDRAGKGLALAICSMIKHLEPHDPVVRLLAGPGNNGGDAFAAALFLDDLDVQVEVWLACSSDKLRGAARLFFDQMVDAEIPCFRLATEKEWDVVDEEALPPPILVDALLGTGSKGAPVGMVRRAIEYLRARSGKCLIVSADMPSGMNADTGEMHDPCVLADYTVTMGYPKCGMAFPESRDAVGSLWSAEIGLPTEYAAMMPDAFPDLQWISEADVRRAFPRRKRNAHKGDYGRTLLMGGSASYPGAIALAAQGASRSGVGLIRVSASDPGVAAVLAQTPEAMAVADLSADFPLEGLDSILLGPGLGKDPEARRLAARLLHETPCPLVLDADAIAVMAGKPEAIRQCIRPVVLTPHPGELATLLGKSVEDVQKNRLGAVREAAERTGAVVVLKGSGTLVAQKGKPARINLNGNPGMACGGSGDVLAGLLAGLLAQGIDPFDAACAAAWLHGAAGDVAALRRTQAGMKAGDVAEALPSAFAQAGIK